MLAHPPSLDSRCRCPIPIAVDQFLSSSIDSSQSSIDSWPFVACPLGTRRLSATVAVARLLAAASTLAWSPQSASLPTRPPLARPPPPGRYHPPGCGPPSSPVRSPGNRGPPACPTGAAGSIAFFRAPPPEEKVRRARPRD
jgi:hypothetical protein